MTVSLEQNLSNHQKENAMSTDSKSGYDFLLGSYLLNRYEEVTTYSNLPSIWYAFSIIEYQLYKHN